VVYSPPSTGATEEYDGTSWTTNPASLNTARYDGLAGAGTTTAALAFGGSTVHLLQVQQKNGQVQEHQQQLQSQLLNTLLIHLINVERVKK
jgi:galactokinase